MENLKSTFPIFTTNPFFFKTKAIKPSKFSIKPPPPDFDFRTEIMDDSRAKIAQTHPQLLDLANNGSLVLIEKSQYGPVPAWRTEFVEPEAIWLVGTTHISEESAVEVERVVQTVKPDNVVVELCRSRQVWFGNWDFFFFGLNLVCWCKFWMFIEDVKSECIRILFSILKCCSIKDISSEWRNATVMKFLVLFTVGYMLVSGVNITKFEPNLQVVWLMMPLYVVIISLIFTTCLTTCEGRCLTNF